MDWPSPETLLRNNLAILADRQRWPKGALAACRRIGKEHPGWHCFWMAKWTAREKRFSHAEGFYAQHGSDSGHAYRHLYGPNPEALARAIERDGRGKTR